MNWTSDQVADLTRLRAEGQTSSEIGIHLGITRNAVIGKAARLGLPLPNDTRPRYRPASRAPRQPRPPRDLNKLFQRPSFVALEPLIIEEPPKPLEFLGIDLLDLTRHTCHFPRGEGPFTFCGQPVERGSYCAHCHRIVYTVPRPSRRKPFVQLGWGAS